MTGALKLDETVIAERAYQIWLDNGQPEGTAEQDWDLAIEQILDDAQDFLEANGLNS